MADQDTSERGTDTALAEAMRTAMAAAEEASTRQDEDPRQSGSLEAERREPELDRLGRVYATGKRKNAVARVWVKRGMGTVTVNGKSGSDYFVRPVLQMIIGQPIETTNRRGQYDVWCTVKGGGLSGQAGAVRHGISKALALIEPGLRPTLKQGGFLTRDSRIVERKKYGKRKARRSFQFSKR